MIAAATNAERSIIGILIADPSARHEAQRLLTSEDFFAPPNRILWDYVAALGSHVSPTALIDALTSAHQLDAAGGALNILDIATEATGAEHIPFLAEQLTTARIHREASRIARQLLSSLEGGGTDPLACVGEAMAELGGLGSGRTQMPDIREDVLKTVENLEAEMSGTAPQGIETRWPTMNASVPLRRASYVVIGGPTSSGKSLFAGNLVADVIEHGRAAFFSYEMSRDDIIRRMLSDKGGIDPEKLFFPAQHRMTPGNMASLVETQRDLSRSGLHIFDDPSIDITRLLALGRLLCAEKPLDALVVDYAQLVPISLPGSNRELQVATISRMLRGFSLETGTPTIVLSQLNDDGATRESKALAQDAEILLNIESDRGGIYVCKQRNGPKNFRLNISQRPGTLKFMEEAAS